jgi:homoserine O-acetyltransferase
LSRFLAFVSVDSDRFARFIATLRRVIGGSLGGMQALEWAILYPETIRAIAVIAAPGRHSAWCIGLSEAQRQAIYADPHWQNGHYEQQLTQGLAAARMMSMSLYRSWASFSDRFGRQTQGTLCEIVNYMHHQGQKLVDRFDANTHITLTHAMDSHDVTRGNDYAAVLHQIHQPALIAAISSDVLYPPVEPEKLAAFMPNAQLTQLQSLHGHDAFLIEMETLNDQVVQFETELDAPRLLKFKCSTS